jgi:tRNA nucleotidyltransferase/poly(A) polymerase
VSVSSAPERPIAAPIQEIEALIQRVIAAVRNAGRPAWLVGGYVRDRLLGRPSHDLDLIVPTGGIALAQMAARTFGGAFFVLDESRDVGRAILRSGAGETLEVDVARLREPELLADLSLRDFTVNAIAVDISAAAEGVEGWGRVIDPFEGREDLVRRRLRAVSEGAFIDDPLRMLRAVRQAVELGFSLEEATYSLIRRDAPLLAAVAAERARDELVRVIAAPGAWQHLRLLADLDLLPHVLPEISATVGVLQSPPHYQDVFDHTRSVMAHLEGIYDLLWPKAGYRRPSSPADDPTVIAPAAVWDELGEALAPFTADLRAHLAQPLSASQSRRTWLPWAALTHDWGKPAMRTVDPAGRVRFLEHDHWGALLVERRGQALKLSSDEVTYISGLADAHMRPGLLAHDYPPSRRAIYHFYRDVADSGPDCALLSLADYLATRAAQIEPEHWRRRLGVAVALLHAYFRERDDRVAPPALLNGRQIMAEFGLKPGPQIGELLEGLREAQAVGEVTSLDEARAWLAQRVRQA